MGVSELGVPIFGLLIIRGRHCNGILNSGHGLNPQILHQPDEILEPLTLKPPAPGTPPSTTSRQSRPGYSRVAKQFSRQAAMQVSVLRCAYLGKMWQGNESSRMPAVSELPRQKTTSHSCRNNMKNLHTDRGRGGNALSPEYVDRTGKA